VVRQLGITLDTDTVCTELYHTILIQCGLSDTTLQSNLSIATTQDHGRAWSLWTGGFYIQVNYIGKTQGGRREQVVASTGGRYIQVVAKAGLTVPV
jgi:hypothetical protein